jgi:hypothetical protein
VHWNGALLGKTAVVNDNLDPDFEHAYFTVANTPTHPPLAECTLRVEVFDWDRIGEQGVPLNISLVLAGCILCRVGPSRWRLALDVAVGAA